VLLTPDDVVLVTDGRYGDQAARNWRGRRRRPVIVGCPVPAMLDPRCEVRRCDAWASSPRT
jgi:hypothetical protein